MSGEVVVVIGELMVTAEVFADSRALVLVVMKVAEGAVRLVDSGDVTCACTVKCGIVLSKS